MQQEIVNGLVILIIGMASVFAILSLIVFLGRQLIILVNKFTEQRPTAGRERKTVSSKQGIDSKHLAVIAAVIEHATKGTGIPGNIQKIK